MITKRVTRFKLYYTKKWIILVSIFIPISISVPMIAIHFSNKHSTVIGIEWKERKTLLKAGVLFANESIKSNQM